MFKQPPQPQQQQAASQPKPEPQQQPPPAFRITRWAVIALGLLAPAVATLFPAPALTQGSPISGQAITPYSTPAANVPVRVCATSAIGTPCSTAGVTLFADPGMTTPISNPTSTDQYGNYSFWVAPGVYQLQTTATTGVVYTSFVGSLSGGGGGGGGGLTPAGNPYSVQIKSLSGTSLGAGSLIDNPITGVTSTNYFVAKGPTVNVLSSAFGVMDNTGNPSAGATNLVALNSATAYACATTLGAGAARLYIPHGTYEITGTWVFTCPLSVIGDASIPTVLQETAGNANLITLPLNGAAAPSHIEDITLSGSYSTTTGTLLEADAAVGLSLRNVQFQNHGGRGLVQLTGTERVSTTNTTFYYVRWPWISVGDINEETYINTRIIDPGKSGDPTPAGGNPAYSYSYNVNAVNGAFPTSGAIIPESHCAITLIGGELQNFISGSIKSLQNLGGVCIDGPAVTLEQYYLEGAVPNTTTHGVSLGYKEYSHNTATVLAGATSMPIDDSDWFELFMSNPADALANATTSFYAHGTTQNYNGVPPDYISPSAADQTHAGDLSSICAGVSGCQIYRNTLDNIVIGAAASDGNLYMHTGPTHTWPPGAVWYRSYQGSEGIVRMIQDHVHVVQPAKASSGYTQNCSDTALKTGAWKYTPSQLCGDIALGTPYDGLTNIKPTGSQNLVVDSLDMGRQFLGGATIFDPTVTYPAFAAVGSTGYVGLVKGVFPDSNFYMSLVDGNVGNPPTVGGSNAYWALYYNEAAGDNLIKSVGNANIRITGPGGTQSESGYDLSGILSLGSIDAISIPYGNFQSQITVLDATTKSVVDATNAQTMFMRAASSLAISGMSTPIIQGIRGQMLGDIGADGNPTIEIGVAGYEGQTGGINNNLYPQVFFWSNNGAGKFFQALCPTPTGSNPPVCNATYIGNWNFNGNVDVVGELTYGGAMGNVINPTGATTLPNTSHVVSIVNPGNGTPITLPSCGGGYPSPVGLELYILQQSNVANTTTTIISADKALVFDGVNYGTSYTWANAGTIHLVCDSITWRNLDVVPPSGAVATVTVNGSLGGTPTVAANSAAEAGSFTVTTSAGMTPGQPAFTVVWPHEGYVKRACTLQAQGSQAALTPFYVTNIFDYGFTIVPANAGPAATYAISWWCAK